MKKLRSMVMVLMVAVVVMTALAGCGDKKDSTPRL